MKSHRQLKVDFRRGNSNGIGTEVFCRRLIRLQQQIQTEAQRSSISHNVQILSRLRIETGFFFMTTNPDTYDILIIGAGPSGIACAIEAKKAGLNYLVIDQGGIANSIQHFQRDMFFFSTPELLEIGDVPFVVQAVRPTSLDCVKYYRKVAEYYRLHFRFYERIVESLKRDDEFVLRSLAGNEYRSRALVIATGYYDTPNSLNVPGEDLPHVSHFYTDPFPYYQQEVLIVGGKNSAVEAALDLYRHGAKVTVIHRGSRLSEGVKYWLLPDFDNRVAQGAIKVHFNTYVKEFKKEGTVLENSNGEHREHKTDFAFILIGYRPDVTFLQSLGIEIESDSLAPFHNPETMETNVENLFVAGGLVGGRFNNKVFIENGREHGTKIIGKLTERL